MKSFVIAAAILASIEMPAQTRSKTIPPGKPGLTLSTTAFEDGGIIPDRHTMAAGDAAVSPQLTWTNVPFGTATFALILRDLDTAPSKSTNEILHWAILNIPSTAHGLPEGVPEVAWLPDGSVQLLNQKGKTGYMGMAAPSAGPYHHYTFALFALDTKVDLGPGATEADLVKAMDGHILMKSIVVGRFHLP